MTFDKMCNDEKFAGDFYGDCCKDYICLGLNRGIVISYGACMPVKKCNGFMKMSDTEKETWCANKNRSLLAKRNKCWDETDRSNTDCEGSLRYQVRASVCYTFADDGSLGRPNYQGVLTPQMKETLNCAHYLPIALRNKARQSNSQCKSS